jgi:DNA-binding NarL/FixJ family response regulator
VLVADDHDVVRKGLRLVLEAAGHEICGEASTGREATELARELRPDVVIVDLAMPDMDGLEATRLITKDRPSTEVLVFTMQHTEKTVRDVLAAGARGFVLKTDVSSDLLAAVESLLEHRTFLTPAVNDVVLSGFVGAAETDETTRNPLTAREREVVRAIAEGLSTKEISARLGISVKTVESHRANALRTLGLRSISDVVRYAIRNGIIEG